MEAPPIEGADKVIEAYGCFPAFHDREVVELRLLRNTTPRENRTTVSLVFTLHGWESTEEVTENGFLRLVNHHLVRFRFDDVDEINLRDFNHQNVLWELAIEGIEPPEEHARIRVKFQSSYGLEGGFRAVSGCVEEVTPCDEDGIPADAGHA